MKRLVILLILLPFSLFGQQIQDFTYTDCDNVSWNLYTELSNGYGCILVFNDTSGAEFSNSTPALEAVYQNWDGDNSNELRVWFMDMDDNEACPAIGQALLQVGGTFPALDSCSSSYSFYDNLYGNGELPLIVLICPYLPNTDSSIVPYTHVGWQSWVEEDLISALANPCGIFEGGVKSHSIGSRIILSPNPTNGLATITNTEQRITNVEVFDVLGRPVRFDFDVQRSLLDIRHCPAGIYFVRAGQATRKLILH